MRSVRQAIVAVAALTATACVSPEQVDQRDCLRVGALLPFTGGLASVGSNIERALILAAELVNDAGGAGGQPICVVARDTHSELKRGLDSARELVNDDIVALFGPQDDDIAKLTVPLVRDAGIVGISGGTSSPALRIADDGGLWFRTVPSALYLGRQLAERMFADGVSRMAVLYEGGEFGSGWATVLDINFTLVGGITNSIQSFDPDAPSYLDRLRLVFQPGVEAVVLVAHPSRGAAIVDEWAAAGLGGRWYFTPTLNDQVFLNNVPPGVVDGMIGISPAVSADTAGLEPLFTHRWDGDLPLRTAYFYMDAMLLWAVAYEAAGGQPSGAAVAEQLLRVSSAPGVQVGWQDLGDALQRARAGEEIDVAGATGSVDLDDRGELEGGAHQFWRIEGHDIAIVE